MRADGKGESRFGKGATDRSGSTHLSAWAAMLVSSQNRRLNDLACKGSGDRWRSEEAGTGHDVQVKARIRTSVLLASLR